MGQDPHTRPHSQLWLLDLARKVPEPAWLRKMRQSDSARRDSETASLPPAQSLPSSSDTEAARTGRRCRHGGCCWAQQQPLVRLKSVLHQGSAHGLGVRPRRDHEIVLLQDPTRSLGEAGATPQHPLPSPLPPHVRCPCRQVRRHSVTQCDEKSLQRKRMRLRRVLANPRILN